MGDKNDYSFGLAIVVAIIAFITAIKDYDLHKELSSWAKARHLVYGMVGSALTTWAVFEVLLYVGLPGRLCLALAGACGYLGAEVISRLVIGFIEGRINGRLHRHDGPIDKGPKLD